METYGRVGAMGMAWLRRLYHDRPERLQLLLAGLSALVQSHTAAMQMASYGARAVRGARGADVAMTAAT